MTTQTTSDDEAYQTHSAKAVALTAAVHSRSLNNNPALALALAQVHASLAVAAAIHALDTRAKETT